MVKLTVFNMDYHKEYEPYKSTHKERYYKQCKAYSQNEMSNAILVRAIPEVGNNTIKGLPFKDCLL